MLPSATLDHTSTIPIIDLLNEIDALLKDYSHIHGAPNQVHDALADVQYLSNTLSYLEMLFGDEGHVLHIPSPATQKFQEIELSLKADLEQLHNVLKKWPDPPTFAEMVTFGALHNSEFRSLREKLVRHQLSFTVLLDEAIFLPEDDFTSAISSLLTDGEQFVPEARIPPIDASITPNGGSNYTLNTEIEIEQDEYSTPSPVWTELANVLLTLPPTMRLSHLVQKLEQIQGIASSSVFPTISGFAEDVGALLALAKELDERLLKENHFSKDVLKEIRTAVDLEIKFLLYELSLFGTLTKKELHPHQGSLNYGAHPIHGFLQDQRAIFIMVLTLVAGARLTESDPRHQEGTRRDEDFEAALAAVMGVLARHSARVNGWCERRRVVVDGDGVTER